MTAATATERLVMILRDTIVGIVRFDGPDVTMRQMAVFLVAYSEDDGHTVRGLAARLDVSKPAITRALDRLTELGLAKRRPDPRDRRSVLVAHTVKGQAFFAATKGLLADGPKDPFGRTGRKVA